MFYDGRLVFDRSVRSDEVSRYVNQNGLRLLLFVTVTGLTGGNKINSKSDH